MGLTPKKNQRELIPEGNHKAICYGVVDVGTQPTNFGPKRNIKIFWEFPDIRIDLDRDGKTVNLPKVINKTYNPVLHEKSNISIHLTSWRGRSFTEEERDNYDFFKLVGRGCSLTIVHKKSKTTGNMYEQIISIVGPATAMEPENPPMTYAIEEHGRNIPDGVYDWLVEMIKESPEYKGESMPGEQQSLDDTSPDGPDYVDPDGDDIPF